MYYYYNRVYDIMAIEKIIPMINMVYID